MNFRQEWLNVKQNMDPACYIAPADAFGLYREIMLPSNYAGSAWHIGTALKPTL